MDTTAKVYIAISIVVVIGMIVLFWFISKRCPKGVLLAVGAGLWIIGQGISRPPIREMRLIGGLCTMCGFIGGLLGLFDLFRTKKGVGAPPVIPAKSEPPPLPPDKYKNGAANGSQPIRSGTNSTSSAAGSSR